MKQLSVVVPSRLSGPLASHLLELGAEAVDSAPDQSQAQLVKVTGYCSEAALDSLLNAAQKTLDRLARRLGVLPVPRFEANDLREDWQTSWVLQLSPVHLGQGLVVVPEGVDYRAHTDERVLWLEPGLFFGFGEHPTTRLMCDWIAGHCAQRTVLDVGCGTGVLSFVAAHAQARSVVGVDIDTASVASATRNARRNAWDSQCTFFSQPLENIGDQFDVVLANIEAPTLCSLAAALVKAVAPQGRLALAGLLEEQLEEVCERFAACGMPLRATASLDGWVLLTNTLTLAP